jgi:hypothetical protein
MFVDLSMFSDCYKCYQYVLHNFIAKHSACSSSRCLVNFVIRAANMFCTTCLMMSSTFYNASGYFLG